jgi:enoyl-CoA hydratase/carnithine racemase
VAKDILFSARFIEADEALRLGLVNFVADAAQLEDQVLAYAARIAANAPLTVHAAKAAMQVFELYAEPADATQAARIATLVANCFDSNDYREGRRAFMEKRSPQFKGL